MVRNGRDLLAYQQTQAIEPAMQSQDMAHVYPFVEDEGNLLDPAILEPSMIQQHQSMQYRRDSFSHGLMSPTESQPWESSYQSMLPINKPHNASQQFQHEQSNYGTDGRSAGAQLMMHAPWSAHHDSPSNAHPGSDMVPQLQTDDAMFALTKPGEHVTATQNTGLGNGQPYYVPAQAQTPISPQSHHEWMAFAQQENESRLLTKRVRPTSPPRSVLNLHRDGAIQKKNKRIDIPQERNIQTIDQMIEKTEDEELLKELKAQKRLLRNREAALASRQRKKKHTEDLEKSEKGYVSQIGSLEKEVETLAMERNSLHRDREILMHRHQDAERVIEAMQMEKRDLIMKHTEETASLRKKVQVLMEQLEAASAPTMSAAPSSTGYTDFNAEMEALSMGAHDWDSFMLHSDLHANGLNDVEFSTPQTELRKQSDPETITPVPESVTEVANSTDKPVASGLLFMLLLCGAFVASRPAITNKINLPAMPPDVQAAAPTVLHNLLGDSSISGFAHPEVVSHIKQTPQPSRGSHMPDRMTELHRSLTAPTRQQEIDSAFALTQAQYAAYSNADMTTDDAPHRSSTTPRPTLAQALAEPIPVAGEGQAAVYTRSLLWDQIPADVVRQFKQLVRSRAEMTDGDV